MKTCTYRNAQPRSVDEGLFCIDEPDVRYGLIPCGNRSLCTPQYDVDRRGQPSIYFGPNQEYYFLNGYRTILNCNATCRTKNMIYVLKCPCDQFEYIGETSLVLSERLFCKFLYNSYMHIHIFM